MARCIAIYPALKLPAHPEIQQLFAEAKATMSFAALTVSGPAGCTVRLFGVAVGHSPLKIPRVATGLTPIELECGEAASERRHLVNIERDTNSVRIDPRFDRALHTAGGALQLMYDHPSALQANLDTDADAIERELRARVVLLESHDTAVLSRTTYKVSTRAPHIRELGELHYDQRTGVARGELRRIVHALRLETSNLDIGTTGVSEGRPEARAKDQSEKPTAARNSLTEPVVGAALGVLGVGGLVTGWALYVERQNYRLEARPEITGDVLRSFRERGSWMLGITGAATAGLVATEYLLLPRSDDVPVLAWIAGGAGVVAAAVGVAYSASSTPCEPMALPFGAHISKACYSRTSDALFGPMLMLSSLPLLNVPLIYMLRGWLGGSSTQAALTSTGLTVYSEF
ncbi:MAG TPA: hypothetical protein VFN67_36720 [Polyangiales bacterium]|nr:hypothetical protein [Polyangiales bacterium]